MKKTKLIIRLLSFFAVVFILTLNVFGTDYKYTQGKAQNELSFNDIVVYPGGMPFGVKIYSKGLTVVKFASNECPAYKAGIKVGDIIVKINDKEINSIEDFSSIVNIFGKNPLNVTVLRNDKSYTFKVTPIYSPDDGCYKTGIWVKDSTSGIGTVTFINPENNSFGGLGHGICDSINGKVIPLAKGTVLDVNINGVVKGKVGSAGELKGSFTNKKIGSLTKNCSQGVFGFLSDNNYQSPEDKMKLCPKEEICEGEAYIWCTLNGDKPEKYSVEISNIDLNNQNGIKNFRVKVTDLKLLESSGGIVQGMSGSPIIQNGRLIGAVTHVLINDPTCGYGIFIENMINQI